MSESTTRDRVAAVDRAGPVTEAERADATALLDDLLAAARQHNITLVNFDWVTDLPGACVDVVRAQVRKQR